MAPASTNSSIRWLPWSCTETLNGLFWPDSKLKQFRAVATRYDKRERIYQGSIDVASIRIWLRNPVP